MTTTADDIRRDFQQHGRVANKLSEAGVNPNWLEGDYYTVDDAVYRDTEGWYVIARPVNDGDGEGRLYIDLQSESDGNRIVWK